MTIDVRVVLACRHYRVKTTAMHTTELHTTELHSPQVKPFTKFFTLCDTNYKAGLLLAATSTWDMQTIKHYDIIHQCPGFWVSSTK